MSFYRIYYIWKFSSTRSASSYTIVTPKLHTKDTYNFPLKRHKWRNLTIHQGNIMSWHNDTGGSLILVWLQFCKFYKLCSRVVFLFLACHNSGTSPHSRKHKCFTCVSLKTDVCYFCECTQATDINASSIKMSEIWTLPNLRPPLYSHNGKVAKLNGHVEWCTWSQIWQCSYFWCFYGWRVNICGLHAFTNESAHMP